MVFWHGSVLYELSVDRARIVYNNFLSAWGFFFDIFASLWPMVPFGGPIDHQTFGTEFVEPTLFARL